MGAQTLCICSASPSAGWQPGCLQQASAHSHAVTCLPVSKRRKASPPTTGRRSPCWEALRPRESIQIPAGTHTFGSFSSESRGQRVALPDRVITVPVPVTWTNCRVGGIIPIAERHKTVSHHLIFCPWLCPRLKANSHHFLQPGEGDGKAKFTSHRPKPANFRTINKIHTHWHTHRFYLPFLGPNTLCC